MNDKLREWFQHIEDIVRWRLVWNPDSKKFEKMLVYEKEDLKSADDGRSD